MKKLLLLLLITFSIHSYSQIVFEKGYFINNNDQKIDCLIKNLDWNNTPTEFEYKLEEQDKAINTTIKQVKEFGIYNVSKYERYTVNIDISSEDINLINYNKNPEYKEEYLFLKVLVQGKASLYQYDKNNRTRFLFKTDSVAINQLICKSYKVSEDEISKNNQFRQQIWAALKCDNISIKNIENLNYKKTELINIFIKYNKCNDNTQSTNFEKEGKEKNVFNLNIRPGVKLSSLSVTNDFSKVFNRDFDSKIGFRMGIEAEYILPFNKNKWSLIIEPTYQSYKAEKPEYGKKTEVDYKSIELPVGARHYFFLNDNSKIFINAQYVIEKAFNSQTKIQFNSNTTDVINIKPKNSFAFGVGYNYKKKYITELRFSNKDILGNYLYWKSDYKTISLIFGYTLF